MRTPAIAPGGVNSTPYAYYITHKTRVQYCSFYSYILAARGSAACARLRDLRRDLSQHTVFASAAAQGEDLEQALKGAVGRAMEGMLGEFAACCVNAWCSDMPLVYAGCLLAVCLFMLVVYAGCLCWLFTGGAFVHEWGEDFDQALKGAVGRATIGFALCS